MNEDIFEVKAIFKGNVQGVFFRSAVKNHASDFEVQGYVKNLANGDVEMVAQGKKSELEKFLLAIKQNPGNGSIEKVNYSYRKSIQKLEGFEIF